VREEGCVHLRGGYKLPCLHWMSHREHSTKLTPFPFSTGISVAQPFPSCSDSSNNLKQNPVLIPPTI